MMNTVLWLCASVLVVAVGIILLVALILVLIRALWDPVYCCFVSGSDMCVTHSSPLWRVTDAVHISEHLVTSGSETWLQKNLTKYSRMVIVADGPRLALFNVCPLTEAVKSDLSALGTVELVCATNCFHYMCMPQYLEAFPNARAIVPAGLLLKRPELSNRCEAFPEECGSVFPGTQYFRLPDFHQEHVIYVEDAHLLWCADTLSPHQPNAQNPGRTALSPLIWPFVGRLCMSTRQWQQQYDHAGTILFADYSRQFRPAGTAARQLNENVWKSVLALPIKRVATAHGHYSGWVDVTQESLSNLLENIQAEDSCWDMCGRVAFQSCVLGCPRTFSEWTPLFADDARTNNMCSVFGNRYSSLR